MNNNNYNTYEAYKLFIRDLRFDSLQAITIKIKQMFGVYISYTKDYIIFSIGENARTAFRHNIPSGLWKKIWN